jgi:hypothetical protein
MVDRIGFGCVAARRMVMKYLTNNSSLVKLLIESGRCKIFRIFDEFGEALWNY